MCGRYSLAADLEDIQQRFELFASDLTYSPRYNIAPTQPVLAVTNDNGRLGSYMRGGVPFDGGVQHQERDTGGDEQHPQYPTF